MKNHKNEKIYEIRIDDFLRQLKTDLKKRKYDIDIVSENDMGNHFNRYVVACCVPKKDKLGRELYDFEPIEHFVNQITYWGYSATYSLIILEDTKYIYLDMTIQFNGNPVLVTKKEYIGDLWNIQKILNKAYKIFDSYNYSKNILRKHY